MNPALFRKFVELKLIGIGTEVDVKYEYYNDDKLVKQKGVFKIAKMYSHPFSFNTIVQLHSNTDDLIEIDYSNIQKISGIDPIKLGAMHKIRPDGCSDDAPKRRGRKPKAKLESDVNDDYNEDEEEEEEA